VCGPKENLYVSVLVKGTGRLFTLDLVVMVDDVVVLDETILNGTQVWLWIILKSKHKPKFCLRVSIGLVIPVGQSCSKHNRKNCHQQIPSY